MRALLDAERSIGRPLARAANSRQTADVLLALARVGRLAQDASTRARGAVVHALSLPSHRDVELLEAKVERLQRAIEELSAAELDRRDRP
jgi:hypothetical protein